VLVHWKEREPLYRARVRRIREALGHVPPYAVAASGAPVDVEPARQRRAPATITAPQDPTQVSRQDFDDMVRNLGIEDEQEDGGSHEGATPAPAGAGRPAGGRRARARAGGQAPGSRAAGEGPSPADRPDDGADKPKKSRNRRHGRPR
jgi:SecD/SecF fusion protein